MSEENVFEENSIWSWSRYFIFALFLTKVTKHSKNKRDKTICGNNAGPGILPMDPGKSKEIPKRIIDPINRKKINPSSIQKTINISI